MVFVSGEDVFGERASFEECLLEEVCVVLWVFAGVHKKHQTHNHKRPSRGNKCLGNLCVEWVVWWVVARAGEVGGCVRAAEIKSWVTRVQHDDIRTAAPPRPLINRSRTFDYARHEAWPD